MECKVCKKNIDSIYPFIQKPYCSIQCEQKDDGETATIDNLFKMFSQNN
jgi:endogenous inhibitor of DNA gyrase (YacG/DUF329 family)